MHIPTLPTALPGAVAPMNSPLRDVGSASTSSIVWAVVCIAVWASLLGLAALYTARHRAGSVKPPPTRHPVASRNEHSQRRRQPLARAA